MKLVLCIIAAEAMTQLACKAEIFDDWREKFKSSSDFGKRLIECPYCVSVWVATFTAFLYYHYDQLYMFVVMLVIHRMSNFLHDVFRVVLNFKIDQILNRRK